ncbi:MAG: Rieske 2Fe-2S domain-containing protein [Nitrososphaerota archaeon]|nr:Rieske 2Fe-2S domain-containing protein [Nitrososphaerota archaeon]
MRALDRREFIRRAAMSAVFGVIGVLGFVEAFSKLADQSQTGSLQISTTASGSLQAPAGYVFVAPLTALAGKTSAYFNHPAYGSSILVDFGGQWRAFSALCTHAGCVVNFTGSAIYCPCHAGSFSPSNGSVQGGPPPLPLPEYGVTTMGGMLYVSQARIN